MSEIAIEHIFAPINKKSTSPQATDHKYNSIEKIQTNYHVRWLDLQQILQINLSGQYIYNKFYKSICWEIRYAINLISTLKNRIVLNMVAMQQIHIEKYSFFEGVSTLVQFDK
jgi:hypothetical protein